MFGIVLTLIFFSGFTGLVYQVAWQKYLAIFLGSHSFATALTLSGFFFYLAAGYYCIGRLSPRLLKNKLLLYGVLEGLIGAYALVSPVYFDFLFESFQFTTSSLELEVGLQFLFTSLYIGFPTFLMGGTIPVLTQGLSQKFELSQRVHTYIYGMNTLGAFAGTLACGFVFIEIWGLPLTLTYNGVLNISLLFATYFLYKISPEKYVGLQPTEDKNTSTDDFSRRSRWLLYTISFLSGFYVFSLESLLIRMAGMSFGSSTYTYSIIVSSFILAIAIGSLSLNRIHRPLPISFLLGVQVLLVLSTMILYLSIPSWPELFLRIRFFLRPVEMNFYWFWGVVLFCYLVLLLIPVGLMGMNLPLLFHFLKQRDKHLGPVVGHVYSINSVGSTLGALFGGYYLFHFLNAPQVFKLNLCLILLVIPAIAYLFWTQEKLKKNLASGLAFVSLIVIWALPNWSESDFVPGKFLNLLQAPTQGSFDHYLKGIHEQKGSKKIVFTQHDPNTFTHVLKDESGDLSLWVNGKADAHTKEDATVRTLTALTPLSLAPTMENVFIIGLGAGLSTGITASFDEVKSVEVAEISEGVVKALPLFAPWNPGLTKQKEKVHISIGDAYKILSQREKKYDLIFCEPSHTWVTGVEKLFSLEFLEKASSKLKETGIYSQWFPLFDMKEDTLLTILKNFSAVFPEVTVWTPGGYVVFLLGSKIPLTPNPQHLESRFEAHKSIYEKVGLHSPYSILNYQLLPPLSTLGLGALAGQFHTLEKPVLAFQSGRAYFVRERVHLDELLHKYMKKPIVDEIEKVKFVRDRLPKKLPEKAYEDALNVITVGANMSFARHRLLFELNKLGTTKKEWALDQSSKEQYEYLLSETDRPLPSALKDTKETLSQQLFKNYRLLIAMHLPARLPRLLQTLPAHCKTSDCSIVKMDILELDGHLTTQKKQTYLSQTQVPSVQSEIDGNFQRHYDTIRKLSNTY